MQRTVTSGSGAPGPKDQNASASGALVGLVGCGIEHEGRKIKTEKDDVQQPNDALAVGQNRLVKAEKVEPGGQQLGPVGPLKPNNGVKLEEAQQKQLRTSKAAAVPKPAAPSSGPQKRRSADPLQQPATKRAKVAKGDNNSGQLLQAPGRSDLPTNTAPALMCCTLLDSYELGELEPAVVAWGRQHLLADKTHEVGLFVHQCLVDRFRAELKRQLVKEPAEMSERIRVHGGDTVPSDKTLSMVMQLGIYSGTTLWKQRSALARPGGEARLLLTGEELVHALADLGTPEVTMLPKRGVSLTPVDKVGKVVAKLANAFQHSKFWKDRMVGSTVVATALLGHLQVFVDRNELEAHLKNVDKVVEAHLPVLRELKGLLGIGTA